ARSILGDRAGAHTRTNPTCPLRLGPPARSRTQSARPNDRLYRQAARSSQFAADLAMLATFSGRNKCSKAGISKAREDRVEKARTGCDLALAEIIGEASVQACKDRPSRRRFGETACGREQMDGPLIVVRGLPPH